MNIIEFGQKYEKPIAVALGFFDCIHLGHGYLADIAKNYAETNGIQSALLTFSNDPSGFFGGEQQIYDFSTRTEVLKSKGIDNIISARFEAEFAAMEPETFLNRLTNSLNVRYIVVGKDYTFGKNAGGNVEFLQNYCNDKNIVLDVRDFKKADGKKISTSSLKKYVRSGNVSQLNKYLTSPYFIIGTVMHERSVGHKLGFPTANILSSRDRLPLCDGVYAAKITVDGNSYEAMTNVGTKPTFSIDTPSVEAFIFDFNGDIYGKEVKLEFFERTRDVTKFSSADELKAQLEKDEKQIRKILRGITNG